VSALCQSKCVCVKRIETETVEDVVVVFCVGSVKCRGGGGGKGTSPHNWAWMIWLRLEDWSLAMVGRRRLLTPLYPRRQTHKHMSVIQSAWGASDKSRHSLALLQSYSNLTTFGTS
jgi:hypothetical protein